MKNISYAVKISLHPQYMRSALIGGQFCENEQFPFDRIYLEIKETHHCPFCGKSVVGHCCDCEEFTSQFAKLQESFHDESHETKLHVYPYENLLCDKKKDTKISVESLTPEEISKLGPDFWDDAEKVVDVKTNRSYYVVNSVYEEGNLDFTFKDLQTKAVCRCSMKGIGYKNHKIYLGVLRYRVAYRQGDDKTIGNSYRDPYWTDVAEFDDWNAFCEKIKSI